MPLRDHFRPPLDNRTAWEGFHTGWPMMIVVALQRRLPRRYADNLSIPLELEACYEETCRVLRIP